jgi:hypothetical protein
MTPIRIWGIGLCVSLVIAGCGDGGSSSGSSEPLSKREYQQQLVRLYIDAQAVGDIYPNLEIETASESACRQTLHQYVDLVSSLIERLADLNPGWCARHPGRDRRRRPKIGAAMEPTRRPSFGRRAQLRT